MIDITDDKIIPDKKVFLIFALKFYALKDQDPAKLYDIDFGIEIP